MALVRGVIAFSTNSGSRHQDVLPAGRDSLELVITLRIGVEGECRIHAGGIGETKSLTDRGPELKTLPESYYDSLKSGRGRVIMASSRSGTRSRWSRMPLPASEPG